MKAIVRVEHSILNCGLAQAGRQPILCKSRPEPLHPIWTPSRPGLTPSKTQHHQSHPSCRGLTNLTFVLVRTGVYASKSPTGQPRPAFFNQGPSSQAQPNHDRMCALPMPTACALDPCRMTMIRVNWRLSVGPGTDSIRGRRPRPPTRYQDHGGSSSPL